MDVSKHHWNTTVNLNDGNVELAQLVMDAGVAGPAALLALDKKMLDSVHRESLLSQALEGRSHSLMAHLIAARHQQQLVRPLALCPGQEQRH